MNAPINKKLSADLAFIAEWVPEGARVLDLGCGEGELLEYLKNTRGCTGYGVECDDTKLAACARRGVNVIHHDLEKGLTYFKDGSFDMVLCLSALQMMKNVEQLLRETARVGRQAVVSFPNFAYWPHRLSLAGGRMPMSAALSNDWFNTPNLRFATMGDFEDLTKTVGLDVVDFMALNNGKRIGFLPNLRGALAVYRLKKKV